MAKFDKCPHCGSEMTKHVASSLYYECGTVLHTIGTELVLQKSSNCRLNVLEADLGVVVRHLERADQEELLPYTLTSRYQEKQ